MVGYTANKYVGELEDDEELSHECVGKITLYPAVVMGQLGE